MRTYASPGNVREMMNRARRAVVLCKRRLISSADLEFLEPPAAGVEQPGDTRQNAEAKAILYAVALSNGNISHAAHLPGISRGTRYLLMKKHGVLPGVVESNS